MIKIGKVIIVVVSDTHICSYVGLTNPERAGERNNAFLEWVCPRWMDFCLQWRHANYLILVGDLGEGTQDKISGNDVVTTNIDDQVEIAKKMLKPIVGPKMQIYGVNGSGYHGGERQCTSIDRRIVEALGGKFKGNIFEFDVGNERIQVAHGGSGSLVNPLTYLLREIKLSKEDAQKRKVKGPTILVRGHQHRSFILKDDAGVWGILNGCWQYVTPFMAKKSANITPSIGGTIIEIEDGMPPKIYSWEYVIPESVRQAMVGYEVLKEGMTLRNEENQYKTVARFIEKRQRRR